MGSLTENATGEALTDSAVAASAPFVLDGSEDQCVGGGVVHEGLREGERGAALRAEGGEGTDHLDPYQPRRGQRRET